MMLCIYVGSKDRRPSASDEPVSKKSRVSEGGVGNRRESMLSTISESGGVKGAGLTDSRHHGESISSAAMLDSTVKDITGDKVREDTIKIWIHTSIISMTVL